MTNDTAKHESVEKISKDNSGYERKYRKKKKSEEDEEENNEE